jgi:hypothetical protein
MPDWINYVRHRLPPLSPERETKIIEELAQCFEARYQEAVLASEPDEKALSMAMEQMQDWEALGREILRAERTMTYKEIYLGAGGESASWLDMGRDIRQENRGHSEFPAFLR